MADTDTDAAKVRIPPPLIYVILMFLGFAVHRWVWELPIPLSPEAGRLATVVTALLGGGCMVAAMGLFRRSGQDPAPWKPTPEMVTGGIYRYTRNPMYVGMALIQASFAFHKGIGWVLLLVPASLFFVFVTAVRQEERYLEEKFGDAYRRYRSSVRRWL